MSAISFWIVFRRTSKTKNDSYSMKEKAKSLAPQSSPLSTQYIIQSSSIAATASAAVS